MVVVVVGVVVGMGFVVVVVVVDVVVVVVILGGLVTSGITFLVLSFGREKKQESYTFRKGKHYTKIEILNHVCKTSRFYTFLYTIIN